MTEQEFNANKVETMKVLSSTINGLSNALPSAIMIQSNAYSEQPASIIANRIVRLVDEILNVKSQVYYDMTIPSGT